MATKKLIEFYKHGTPRDAEENVEYMKNTSVENILREGKLGGDLGFLLESADFEVGE